MPKRKPKPIRASTKKKPKTKKAGLLKALHNSLNTDNLGLTARQGAGHIGMIMMLRAKRLRKWLLWLKRRRLRLKKRLRNLVALEKLLHEEMLWTKECQTAFRLMIDPRSQKSASSDSELQSDLESQDGSLNADEIRALLASFPRSKNPSAIEHRAGTETGPYYRSKK